ncbi:hypothetical protein BGZ58_010692 [Dissophora ornata]|nr:hypothetical protein BGZ58_010692 [Dissophora ornata]
MSSSNENIGQALNNLRKFGLVIKKEPASDSGAEQQQQIALPKSNKLTAKQINDISHKRKSAKRRGRNPMDENMRTYQETPTIMQNLDKQPAAAEATVSAIDGWCIDCDCHNIPNKPEAKHFEHHACCLKTQASILPVMLDKDAGTGSRAIKTANSHGFCGMRQPDCPSVRVG